MAFTPDDHTAIAPDGARFALPSSLHGWAVFLDIDGTLIDIAATPDAIVVPPRLAGDLTRAAQAAGGALALVSGRAVAAMDRIFAPASLAAAGVHGAELRRLAGGAVEEMSAPPELAALRPALRELVDEFPGTSLEDKGRAIAVHFRGNPDAGPAIELAVAAMAAQSNGALATQRGKMVIELKPAAAGKGAAVRRLMIEEPFAGRRPLAIGDDITDEAMFEAASELGGVAIRIGTDRQPTAASYLLPEPAAVRAWLASLP